MRGGVGHVHGAQSRRRFVSGRMTCRTRLNADARVVQVRENALPVDVFEGDVRRVWQTLRTIRRTVQTRVRDVLQDLVLETVAQRLHRRVTVIVKRELTGRTESHDVWNG